MRIQVKSFAISLVSTILVFSGLPFLPGVNAKASVSFGGPQTASPAPARRAVIVGIGIYNPDQVKAEARPKGSVRKETPRRQPAQASKGGTGGRKPFANLDGPKTDVAKMNEILKNRFGFTRITELRDQQATRAAILQAIQKHLIDEASEGDICVFYYSGHGSQVKNSKGGEADGMDESIVPADYKTAPDIRDKELARLFLKAMEKKVKLTVILDSCHSGSAARGYPQEERTRAVDPVVEDANDPPGFDKSPEELGALVLSAAQDREEAKERRYKGVWRGNFSYALSEILSQPSAAYQSTERIFQMVTGIMRSEGVSHQPVLAGNSERRKGALFGNELGITGGPVASVVKKLDRPKVELQGGVAMGIRKDTELKSVAGGEKPVRLRVTDVKGLNTSEAMVIQGSVDSLKAGDLFVIDSWVAPDSPDLRVWIPAALASDELDRIAREVSALRGSGRIEWIADPTVKAPSLVVQFEQGEWKKLYPGGNAETLGPAPTVSNIASDASAPASLFFNIPPSDDLRKAIKLGSGTERRAIEITRSPGGADYILAGRLEGDKLQYAWVRPGVSADDMERGGNPLPVRTSWVDASDRGAATKLEEYAVTLSRIRAWHQVSGGPTNDFPYTLVLRNSRTKEILREAEGQDGKERVGEVREGEKYDLVLIADEAALKRLQDAGRRVSLRWVYVFSIDTLGNSTLLFNERGNINNQFPVVSNLPPLEQPREILLGDERMIEMGEPFGLDTYILLTSEEAIPDPYILQFSGVVRRGKGTADDPKSARLFSALGSGTRAPKASTPLNWSIDRFVLRSVGKSQ
ncbi:MAG: caspase family protein [Blastocatellia bacterium]|nr:caspase family protein [Blastocatellia bacterium]